MMTYLGHAPQIHFESPSDDEKFSFILSNEDTAVVSQVGYIIFKCLKIRDASLR